MHKLSLSLLSGLILAIASMGGCGPNAPQTRLQVLQPDVFQLDGHSWEKTDWNKEVESKIAKHLRRSPYLADNPSLGGEPVCYSNGTKQRVYWLSTADQTSQWSMIEFTGSRGSELVEGSGAPFVDVVAQED